MLVGKMSPFVKCSVILFCSNYDWHFRKWWSPHNVEIDDVEENMCDAEDLHATCTWSPPGKL